MRQGYEFGVPEEGFYEEILNTDAEMFGGTNMGNGGMRFFAARVPAQPAAQYRGDAAAARRGGISKSLMPKYDAIIVGGGHNGLVAAAYLARGGRKVLVLERRELVGGCAVTEEIWPGYRVSTAAYLTSLLQERIVRELELPRYGYRVDAKDPAFFSAFPDGRHFFMWQDRAKTLAEIAKFSRHDAEVYPAYEDQIERLAQVVEGLLLTTPPHFPPRAVDFVDYLKLTGKLRGLGARDAVALVKIFTQSAAEFLDEWFESEEVKVTLATDGVIGANGGPRSPGTAYILLHHCMGGVAGHRGLWGFVRGGMGAVSEAIAASARASGVTIRVNAPVAKVLVRGGSLPKAARGVVLESGEEIEASAVASNLDPKLTFLRLLDERGSGPGVRPRHPQFPHRRHQLQNQSGAQRSAGVHGLSRRARPAPQSYHAHLPQHRVRGARLGRRQVRPRIGAPAAGIDHSHHVRPLARAARQTHHGHLPAIRALHPARGHVGRIARAVRRPCDFADRGSSEEFVGKLRLGQLAK